MPTVEPRQNMLLKGVLGVLALALIIYIAAQTRNALESYNYIGKVVRDRDTITVSGEGKVNAKPDLVRLDLGVQTDANTVKEAQALNTKQMNAIVDALKSAGIASKDIQTSGYNIYPRIDWQTGKQVILGYSVSQNVSVKVRDLDKVGEILGRAGDLGANQVGGIQFTVDDPTKLEEEARAKAIDDARKKAEQLADQLGLRIVKVVTFSESGEYPTPVPMYAKAMEAGARDMAASAPSIESGSLDIVNHVNVTFEVR
jgi:uncharacterized protein